MGLRMAMVVGILGCAVAGVTGMAQLQQQQQQSSSHLGQVAKRHGGEEANPANGTTNNVLTTPRTASPAASQVRGGNGVTLSGLPETAKHPVTETLHGETNTDDYRWLEQQHDPATRAWIDEQNAYTDGYLEQVTIRPEIKAELTKLERVDSYSTPVKRGNLYFFKKRLADENQGSIYVRRGVAGADERLVDANKMSADQNTSAGILDVTNDGTLLAYRDACAECGGALHGGVLAEGALRCPQCERSYFLPRAGRSMDDDRLQLEPVPLLREQGRVKVALAG